jgi:hypothetical protein
MNFLLYVENSAENLQFFLWFRDYVKRFDQLSESEKKLSPEWVAEPPKRKATPAKLTSEAGMTQEEKREADQEVSQAVKGTDFDTSAKTTIVEVGNNPFNTPPATPFGERPNMDASTVGWSEDGSTLNSGAPTSHTKASADAFESAKTLQPCKTYRLMAFSSLLTIHSYRPTIPGRDLSYHHRLHCQRRLSSPQSLRQGVC